MVRGRALPLLLWRQQPQQAPATRSVRFGSVQRSGSKQRQSRGSPCSVLCWAHSPATLRGFRCSSVSCLRYFFEKFSIFIISICGVRFRKCCADFGLCLFENEETKRTLLLCLLLPSANGWKCVKFVHSKINLKKKKNEKLTSEFN